MEKRKVEAEVGGAEGVKTQAEDFHGWLVVARLLAMGEGTISMTQAHFD